jgi:hypothetical protein
MDTRIIDTFAELLQGITREIRRGHSSGRGQTAKLLISDTGAGGTKPGVQRVGTECRFNIPGAVSVSFGVVSASGSAFPEAVVSFAVENKAIVRRRITVGNGATITGVADSVDVSLLNNPPPGEFPTPISPEYGVSVDIAMGTRGAHVQPPILMLRDSGNNILVSAAAGAFADFVIPQDAGAIAINVTAQTDPPGTAAVNGFAVEQRRGAIVLKAYDAIFFPGWIPLAPGADTIRVINNTAVRGLFGVVAGIDG